MEATPADAAIPTVMPAVDSVVEEGARSVRQPRWFDRLTGVSPGAAALPGRSVSVGELCVFIAALVVAIVAVASLAMAHLHRYSLTTAVLGTLAGLVLLGLLARAAGRLPRIVLDIPGLLVLVVSALLAAGMFLPGFHYGAGDRDPGGYMMIGAMIAREGSVTITDPVLAEHLPVQVASPGARFAGIWISDPETGSVTPQFYHLWPALLATADKLHGFGGMANTDPLVAVLAVLLAVAVARRLAGLVAAGTVGLLLSTHMMQVWQAKYPSAEILTQMLFMAAVLGLVLAVTTRWRWPSLVSGVLITEAWLCRADGLLLVLLAIGALCTLWVLRRFNAYSWWFAAGLVGLLPYAMYQAYGPAERYTLDNGLPTLTRTLGLMTACVVMAMVLRPVLGRLARVVDRIDGEPVWHRRIGLGLVGLYAALFCLAVVRPVLGVDFMAYHGQAIRSYDERSIYWLSWFFTWPGLVLVLLGFAFGVLRPWRLPLWFVMGPTLLLLPVYLWHARNSPFLMWWGRRYVSTVVPGMVLLIALAIAGLWALRGRMRLVGRVTAALSVILLSATYLYQSLPVRQHDEWGGSYFVTRDMAAMSDGDQGVFLWQRAPYCCAASQSLFAGPLWLTQGQISVLLPSDERLVPDYVSTYVRHFRGHPVYLAYEKGQPPNLPGLQITAARQFTGTLPRWEESSVKRPDHGIQIPYSFMVYRVEAAG